MADRAFQSCPFPLIMNMNIPTERTKITVPMHNEDVEILTLSVMKDGGGVGVMLADCPDEPAIKKLFSDNNRTSSAAKQIISRGRSFSLLHLSIEYKVALRS